MPAHSQLETIGAKTAPARSPGRAVLLRRPDIHCDIIIPPRPNKPPGARSLFPLQFLWLACLFAILFTGFVHAQPTSGNLLVSSNRVLFIINTSSSMKKHAEDMQTIIGKIISSNGDGQFYHGDTIGVWTFNKEPFSDFPLQQWDPNARQAIAARLDGFIKAQKYQDGSHFEKVLPDLFGVMRASDFITVIIFSNGDDKFKGTALDKEINAQIEQTYHDAKDHGIPLAIIIQSRLGKILRHSVTPFPWPIVIPQTPLPKVVPIVRPATVVVPKPAPPPVVPNLIIIGKPQPPPVVAPKPEPAPIVAAPPAETLPSPTPAVAVEPPTTAPSTPEATAPAERTPALAAAPDAKKPSPKTKEVSPAPQPAPEETITPVPATNEPATNALAVLTPPTNRPQLLLFAGIVLFLIAAGLIYFMIQRSRAASSPSFITRSMNNKRKQ